LREGVVGQTGDVLVLVVEDDPDICNLVTDILELDLDVQTASAEDGERGLELTRDLRPNLVLLDIKLPRMSGLEVARRLKADPRTRAIPLVALTSEPRETTLAAGCDDHISKPFDILDLVETTRANLWPQFCRRAA
jgi:CheY-like chemotaxis protein